MDYQKPSRLHYRIAQAASWLVATALFKRKIRRNEIKGKKGPFVVLANHQAALDFVSLIGATRRPMTFVISNSFYSTLPIKGFLHKIGVIPKQQFQTTVRDLKKIRAVVDQGEPVVIYPAGLMCEDGLSTPIPSATYKFLKWLGVDVYMAKISGTYFAMPKWGKGFRPGRTYLDVYKLFSKEELAELELPAVQQRAEEALLFDAYREQEELLVKYKDNDRIEGLQNVLYMCPHCKAEFSIEVRDGHTLACRECGFEQISDAYGFLHNLKGVGEEWRYVSDWSRFIHEELKGKLRQGQECTLSSPVAIHMIDPEKDRFVPVGAGTLCLTPEGFGVEGQIHGETVSLSVPIHNIPTLPFSPGKHLELQQGSTIYRCLPEDGRLAMKYIHMVKSFYELRNETANEQERVG